MTPGAGGGYTALVAPEPRPLAVLQLDDIPPYVTFSNGDKNTAPTVAESGVYELQASDFLGVWVARLKVAGTTNTVVDVLLEDVVLDTVTLGSGVTRAELDLSSYFGEAGEAVTVETTAVGTGARGLTMLAPIK
jgi:hypothetical protein